MYTKFTRQWHTKVRPEVFCLCGCGIYREIQKVGNFWLHASRQHMSPISIRLRENWGSYTRWQTTRYFSCVNLLLSKGKSGISTILNKVWLMTLRMSGHCIQSPMFFRLVATVGLYKIFGSKPRKWKEKGTTMTWHLLATQHLCCESCDILFSEIWERIAWFFKWCGRQIVQSWCI